MGGEISYTIPYTGDFDIILAGSQGGSYNSDKGGCGYTCTKKIRLSKGDVIKVKTPNKPSGTNTSPVGGKKAEMWVNNTLMFVAGGGAGGISKTIADSGVLNIYPQGGEGYTNGASGSDW